MTDALTSINSIPDEPEDIVDNDDIQEELLEAQKKGELDADELIDEESLPSPFGFPLWPHERKYLTLINALLFYSTTAVGLFGTGCTFDNLIATKDTVCESLSFLAP